MLEWQDHDISVIMTSVIITYQSYTPYYDKLVILQRDFFFTFRSVQVITDVARPYVPPGAGEWPYPYPWGDRRFDIRAIGAGATTIKIRYKSAP